MEGTSCSVQVLGLFFPLVSQLGLFRFLYMFLFAGHFLFTATVILLHLSNNYAECFRVDFTTFFLSPVPAVAVSVCAGR